MSLTGGCCCRCCCEQVHDGGLYVKDTATTLETSSTTSSAAVVTSPLGSGYTGDVLSVTANQALGTTYNLVHVLANTHTSSLFAVRGDGQVTSQRGGVVVVTDGVTVTDGGMSIQRDDTTASSAQIIAKGASFTGNALYLKSDKAAGDDFHLLRVYASTTELVNIAGNGLTTVKQGGLDVITGGATVRSGKLMVDSGVTVTAGGLAVATGGTTLVDGGLFVDDDGAVVRPFL